MAQGEVGEEQQGEGKASLEGVWQALARFGVHLLQDAVGDLGVQGSHTTLCSHGHRACRWWRA